MRTLVSCRKAPPSHTSAVSGSAGVRAKFWVENESPLWASFWYCLSPSQIRRAESCGSRHSPLQLEFPGGSCKVRRRAEGFSTWARPWGGGLEDGPGPDAEGSSGETQVAHPGSFSQVCIRIPSVLCRRGARFMCHCSAGVVFIERPFPAVHRQQEQSATVLDINTFSLEAKKLGPSFPIF